MGDQLNAMLVIKHVHQYKSTKFYSFAAHFSPNSIRFIFPTVLVRKTFIAVRGMIES